MCLKNECLYLELFAICNIMFDLDLREEEGVTCNVTFIGHLRTLIRFMTHWCECYHVAHTTQARRIRIRLGSMISWRWRS